MNTVITINLNGRAYQIEEPGYRALRKYLDEAEARLAGNPDKGEIMADFEQAIADKCERRLGASKNVVTTKEIEEIIAAMGPVDGTKNGVAEDSTGGGASTDAGGKTGSANGGTAAQAGGAAPKRLYRIYEGSILKGVCNGIAAYFNVDATLVRVLFVLLTIFTGGGWVIAYIVLMFVMPVARTDDEIARAHGEPPFTAKDFIDRARADYEKFREDPEGNKKEWERNAHQWKQEWREKRRAWREEWRAKQRAERDAWREQHHHPVDGAGVVFGIVISIVLCIVFVAALGSLIFHGAVFGYPLGAGHPFWISLAFVIALFYLIALPFRHLIHNERCNAHDEHCHRHGGSGFFALLFLILFVYTAVTLFPPVRDAWNSLIAYLQAIRT